jgi:rubrerythrin
LARKKTEDVMARKDKLSGPERLAKTVDILRQWQGIERDAIETTAQIMEKTDNLLIRQIMEIIRNDSVQHHRVQQFLIDSITRAPVTLSPEDLAEVWGQLEAHDELERQTIELAKELKEQTTEPMHVILLDYLLRDEEKHDTILGDLEKFKTHMSKIS